MSTADMVKVHFRWFVNAPKSNRSPITCNVISTIGIPVPPLVFLVITTRRATKTARLLSGHPNNFFTCVPSQHSEPIRARLLATGSGDQRTVHPVPKGGARATRDG